MRVLRDMLLAAVIAVWASPARSPTCPADAAWQQLILAHRLRYPEMQLVDVFKLLQQATMGSEHAVGSLAEATAWLDREWATLGDGPQEPLVDTLGQGGRFARVHLRPYRAGGGTPDKLVAAFVATARRFPRDTTRLTCALDVLVGLARAGRVPWSLDSVQARRRLWSQQGYPAVEHSAVFERLYRPAYRVVALALIPPTSPN